MVDISLETRTIDLILIFFWQETLIGSRLSPLLNRYLIEMVGRSTPDIKYKGVLERE